MVRLRTGGVVLALLMGGYATMAPAADGSAAAMAKRFGEREKIIDVSLAPDGQHIAYVVAAKATGTAVFVSDANGGHAEPVAYAAADPLNLTDCGWSAVDRIVCREHGTVKVGLVMAPFVRFIAFGLHGDQRVSLNRNQSDDAMRMSQYSGEVIDWLAGDDGNVLMTRDYVPLDGARYGFGTQPDGFGVDRVDTRSGLGHSVEMPARGIQSYMSDGNGIVRMSMTGQGRAIGESETGIEDYLYRLPGEHGWRPFCRYGPGRQGMRPVAIDGAANVAYVLKSLDGRDALYRVALDGSMKTDLAYANPSVDVQGVVTIGRRGRVIGASYVTDRRQVEYFDPEYRALAASLAKALPDLPLIEFMSASADEKKLILFAGSDIDPGHYYYFDRAAHHLDELLAPRPALDDVKLAPVRSVSYPAADGTMVPAYLTLPPGSAGKAVPAIVMPHGGPAARDEWGFDWLAQFFAQRGFAVLQPEFRGSAGYGDAWYVTNGFRSWKTAAGDINDGARWLEKQGIADPARMAIVGWSYGGYAALQSNVVDPGLFKAAIAIAPVTDLGQMKQEAQAYTHDDLVVREVGDGPHVAEGSPARHADRFTAPVLLFHGDMDANVDVAESRTMDRALHAAGKASQLVVYPGLDHQLDDSDARADMLEKSDAFLRASLKIAAP